MQNKANFRKSQMNVNLYNTTDYENKWQRRVRKYKPNSNPIKANSKPIKANKMPKQTQYKPNTNPIKPNPPARYAIRNTRYEIRDTNPIKPNFKGKKMPDSGQYYHQEWEKGNKNLQEQHLSFSMDVWKTAFLIYGGKRLWLPAAAGVSALR